MKKNPLGRFAVRRFLREHWQKKPLVLRGIAPALAEALTRDDLIDLACRDDTESRLIVGHGRNWSVRHGPFRRRDFTRLPARQWTLLVNGVDTMVPAARDLLNDFSFIPYARQDDVMVSYAAPGGGVGPHFDSYDVFLLQGGGTRRWQFGNQRNLDLIEGVPLKILSRFRAQEDLLMQSGDLLYLPPQYAHNGTAVGECLTWSIGMRAPGEREVAAQFLDFLQDRLQDGRVYRDRDLHAQRHPAEIGAAMRGVLRDMVNSVRWNDTDIDRCLGEMLSEPRQSVVFEPPKDIGVARFAATVKRRGLQLDLKTRMLFDRLRFYINGESITVARNDAGVFRLLADTRKLDAGTPLSLAALQRLQQWHAAGYLQFGARGQTGPARQPR